MARDTRFKPGQSGNPETKFKAGNRFRWQPWPVRQSGGCGPQPVEIRGVFLHLMITQGAAEEAASLLWECARRREPWAVQALLQRLAPETKQIKLTHGMDDETDIDYTRLSNEDLDQLERILERARISTGTSQGGESQTKPEGVRGAGLASPGTEH